MAMQLTDAPFLTDSVARVDLFVMRGSSIAQNGLLFTPVVHASVK